LFYQDKLSEVLVHAQATDYLWLDSGQLHTVDQKFLLALMWHELLPHEALPYGSLQSVQFDGHFRTPNFYQRLATQEARPSQNQLVGLLD
jgi:hypothetical protein